MPTIKMTLEGPPASGKSTIASWIASNYEGYVEIFEEGINECLEKHGDPTSDNRLEILCKQTYSFKAESHHVKS